MVDLKKGDIFFIDSDKTGPKIVKFLMQSPTVWHWAIGKIGKLFKAKWAAKFISPVRMYHAGVFVSPTKFIEQQWKVEYNDNVEGMLNKKHVVWRYKHLTNEQAEKIDSLSKTRLGNTYDLWLILGKTLTWLTGIKWFVRTFESRDKDICITFVAYLYFTCVGYDWGRKSWHEITTDIMDDWNVSHPDDWELITKRF